MTRVEVCSGDTQLFTCGIMKGKGCRTFVTLVFCCICFQFVLQKHLIVWSANKTCQRMRYKTSVAAFVSPVTVSSLSASLAQKDLPFHMISTLLRHNYTFLSSGSDSVHKVVFHCCPGRIETQSHYRCDVVISVPDHHQCVQSDGSHCVFKTI